MKGTVRKGVKGGTARVQGRVSTPINTNTEDLNGEAVSSVLAQECPFHVFGSGDDPMMIELSPYSIEPDLVTFIVIARSAVTGGSLLRMYPPCMRRHQRLISLARWSLCRMVIRRAARYPAENELGRFRSRVEHPEWFQSVTRLIDYS